MQFGRDGEEKVTAISVFDGGAAVRRGVGGRRARSESCGASARSGSATRSARRATADEHHFAPPTLETVVVPSNPDDKAALRVALAQLAEQDPLIDVRQDDGRQELSVSLYGEVQKEVIQATLATDFGIEVEFRETTTICVERPLGDGRGGRDPARGVESVPRHDRAARRPARPAAPAIEFRLEVDARTLPLYLYKTAESFAEHMEQYVREALQEGLMRLAGHRLRRDDDRSARTASRTVLPPDAGRRARPPTSAS